MAVRGTAGGTAIKFSLLQCVPGFRVTPRENLPPDWRVCIDSSILKRVLVLLAAMELSFFFRCDGHWRRFSSGFKDGILHSVTILDFTVDLKFLRRSGSLRQFTWCSVSPIQIIYGGVTVEQFSGLWTCCTTAPFPHRSLPSTDFFPLHHGYREWLIIPDNQVRLSGQIYVEVRCMYLSEFHADWTVPVTGSPGVQPAVLKGG